MNCGLFVVQGWSEGGQADVGPEWFQFTLPGSEVGYLAILHFERECFSACENRFIISAVALEGTLQSEKITLMMFKWTDVTMVILDLPWT